MTTSEFVSALAALVPTAAECAPYWPDPADYASLQQEFIPQRREHLRPLPVPTHTELDALLTNYELVRVTIMGDIQFFETSFLSEGLLTVAAAGNGTFTVSASGEVNFYTDTNSYTAPEFRCSRTVSGFYQALLVLTEYYHNRLIHKIECKDLFARQTYAQQAASAAGEPAASHHYLGLINAALPLP
jgi:hypothetical protein